MAERTVTIRVSAVDSFSQVFDRYERAVRGADQSTERMADNTRRSEGAFSSLTNTLRGVALGFGAMGAVRAGLELRDLGAQVNNARSVFEELSGGVRQADSNLALLRASTRGTVADLDLMQSANALLLQGLAQTGDQAAELTGIAVTLGRAMGEDVNTSISNFSQLLRNQSIRLLDNYGLSSSRVKDKIEELMAATSGLSKEQAFVQAVLSESRLAIERLGDSTVVAGTAVERFEARVTNSIQQAGSNIATGVELIVESLERLGNTWQEQADEAEQSAARAAAAAELMAINIQETIQEAISEGFLTGADEAATELGANADRYVAPLRERMIEAMSEVGFGDLSEQDQLSRLAGIDAFTESAFNLAREILASQQDINMLLGDRQILDMAHNQTMENQQRMLENLRAQEEARSAIIDRDTANLVGGYTAAYERQLMIDRARNDELAAQQVMLMSQERTLASMQGTVGTAGLRNMIEGMATGAGDIFTQFSGEDRVSRFFTRPQASELAILADEAAARLEELQAKFDEGLVTESTLSEAQQLADEVTRMADMAQAGADAFERMSLADVFGQTQGGLQGEVFDIVTQQLQTIGAPQSVISEFTAAGNLQVGRETEASRAMDEIATLLAQGVQSGAITQEQALTSIDQASIALRDMALEGLTPQEIAIQLPAAAGFAPTGAVAAAPGQSFTVAPGQTALGVAAETGLTVDQILAAQGITNPRLLQPGTFQAGGGMGGTGFEFVGFPQQQAQAMPFAPFMAPQTESAFAQRGVLEPLPAVQAPAGFDAASITAISDAMTIVGETAPVAAEPIAAMATDASTIGSNFVSTADAMQIIGEGAMESSTGVQELGSSAEEMAAQTTPIANDMISVAASMRLAAGDISDIRDDTEVLAAEVHQIEYNVTFSGDTDLLRLAAGGLGGGNINIGVNGGGGGGGGGIGVADAMAAVNQANGGTSPGTGANSGRGFDVVPPAAVAGGL